MRWQPNRKIGLEMLYRIAVLFISCAACVRGIEASAPQSSAANLPSGCPCAERANITVSRSSVRNCSQLSKNNEVGGGEAVDDTGLFHLGL